MKHDESHYIPCDCGRVFKHGPKYLMLSVVTAAAEQYRSSAREKQTESYSPCSADGAEGTGVDASSAAALGKGGRKKNERPIEEVR